MFFFGFTKFVVLNYNLCFFNLAVNLLTTQQQSVSKVLVIMISLRGCSNLYLCHLIFRFLAY